MNKFKKALFPLVAFAAGMMGVIGVTAAVVFANGGDETATAPSVHSDKASAEDAAGYEIVNPGNMPERMAIQNFLVSGYVKDNKAESVDQNWYVAGSTPKQWITVTQGPRQMGLMNSKPTTISGVAGEKVLYPSRDSRPYPVLALYWPHDGGHLGIVGSLSDNQTEETLRAIASSLISPASSE